MNVPFWKDVIDEKMNTAFVKAQRARFDMDRTSGGELVSAIIIRVGNNNEENKWLDEKIEEGWLDAHMQA